MHYAGLIYDESFHYLDHLAPFCSLLEWPLILCEPSIAERARHDYPDLEIIEKSLWNLSFSQVVACEPRALLRASINPLQSHTLWLPHGNSDKGWKSAFFESLEEGEPALVYGNQMIDLLRAKRIPVKPIRVGNFRWIYYQKHKSFYDKKIKELSIPRHTNFLYAPTWEDSENNCSFWDAFPILAETIPDSYNLLVKCHPNTYRQRQIEIERLMGRYAKKKNIVFIIDFTPIYPLLEICDAYIGDMSSIGYDFLKFNRPMFFLNMQKGDIKTDRSLYLYRCGREIRPNQLSSLFAFYNRNEIEFKEIREMTYAYAFDSETDLQTIVSSCAALP